MTLSNNNTGKEHLNSSTPPQPYVINGQQQPEVPLQPQSQHLKYNYNNANYNKNNNNGLANNHHGLLSLHDSLSSLYQPFGIDVSHFPLTNPPIFQTGMFEDVSRKAYVNGSNAAIKGEFSTAATRQYNSPVANAGTLASDNVQSGSNSLEGSEVVNLDNNNNITPTSIEGNSSNIFKKEEQDDINILYNINNLGAGNTNNNTNSNEPKSSETDIDKRFPSLNRYPFQRRISISNGQIGQLGENPELVDELYYLQPPPLPSLYHDNTGYTNAHDNNNNTNNASSVQRSGSNVPSISNRNGEVGVYTNINGITTHADDGGALSSINGNTVSNNTETFDINSNTPSNSRAKTSNNNNNNDNNNNTAHKLSGIGRRSHPPSSDLIPGTPDWKRARLLERNRIAANKCRQRKKVQQEQFMRDYERLKYENKELKKRIEVLDNIIKGLSKN
ncbi:uncharacterized protein SCODWIG_03674 [Saccharomycodes ludwigii]|uniref:BZIP domain-containing protein n=1 Tax=Saccharomycodes ludwigii TaxID=36035 RepID=A0A376BB54_9ASCO|nr:uncharacterized protein SCODWIG_03674 [Saccharomycodes ludwigii]